MNEHERSSLARSIRLACLAEATAPKPGNVHPNASFEDLTYNDFRHAAELVAEPLSNACDGVGNAVEVATQRTVVQLGTNVNLGICLLLAPLAAVDSNDWPNVASILSSLTVTDAEAVYRAIRQVSPGGLGDADAEDVKEKPTVTLLEAMRLAADRDGVARQYATNYVDILSFGVDTLRDGLAHAEPSEAIVRLAVRWQATIPDTLIARKCGHAVAREASERAKAVVDDWSRLDDFDSWLREDGHRRNPGTTADIVAAILFAAIRSDAQLATRLGDWLKVPE